MKKNLKEDIFYRLNGRKNGILFGTFSGKEYSIEEIEYYVFNIIKQIKKFKTSYFFL